ncbi:hypothetical protein [Psychrosphaera algicola]|uniref:Uncharacterized protein n=1 Tax=Psychrosphaera algicola TaxID=3023714 RepID=A0ABT5FIM2_9GAMM|nr:hypothetical protein [Psychrosphaera sp. G1-22]MDC2891050.1 hypothetical protein [Psychrosphaera sp. G1-22]
MEVANPYIYDGSFAKYAPTGVQIGDEGVLVPTSANLSMKQDTRERTGIATALQWQSEDSSLKATVQFLRSDSVLSWNEHNINSEWQPGDYRAGAIPGTEFEFDDDGVYESGSITDTSGGWRGDAERSPIVVKFKTLVSDSILVTELSSNVQKSTTFHLKLNTRRRTTCHSFLISNTLLLKKQMMT